MIHIFSQHLQGQRSTMIPCQISKPSSRKAGLPQFLSITLPLVTHSEEQACTIQQQVPGTTGIAAGMWTSCINHQRFMWALQSSGLQLFTPSWAMSKIHTVPSLQRGCSLEPVWCLSLTCLHLQRRPPHLIQRPKKRGQTPLPCTAWLIIPRCESTELCVEGGLPSTSTRADTLHLCLLYNYTWNHGARI